MEFINRKDLIVSGNELNDSNNSEEEKRNIKLERYRWQELIRECFQFIVFFFLIAAIYAVVFLLINNGLFDISTWFNILFYPAFLTALIVWIVMIKEKRFKDYLLNNPRWPKKGHQWLWTTWFILWITFIILAITLFSMKLVYIDIEINGGWPYIISGLFHSCIGAPIVEEIAFRGYFYSKAEEVWGESKFVFDIYREKEEIDLDEIKDKESKKMEHKNDEKDTKLESKSFKRFLYRHYEVLYASLFTSIVFGLYHGYPIQAIITFIGGLIFCKARNDWGKTLIIPIIIHAMWNFAVGLFNITTIPFIDAIFDFLFPN